MKPVQLIVAIIFIGISSSAFSQDLVLYYEKRSRVFKAGSYIEIQLPAPETEDGNDDCVMSILRGRLVRSEADQIVLSVSESSEPLMQGKKRLGYNIKRYEEGDPGPELSIPKEIILSVMHKGNNRVKENTTVETVGYIMMSLGVAHLVSVPVSKALENDNRTGSMAWLGLGELLGGLIVAVLADQKEYVIAESCPGKSGANVWTIR